MNAVLDIINTLEFIFNNFSLYEFSNKFRISYAFLK